MQTIERARGHGARKSGLLLGAGLAGLAFGLAAAPAAAQTDAASVSTVEELVVTAQRREESLSDVPLSVQAITGETLERQGMSDARTLASIAPTINFREGPSASASTFLLRGVTSQAEQGGIQPSTSLVLNGVAVFRQGEFIADLGDIERIEILNGPQGTLFGKNATAGVISIVTRSPTETFEGSLEGLATTDEEYSIRGLLNVPINDRVRLRATAWYRDQHGTAKNIIGPDYAGILSYGFSAKLGIDLAENAYLEIAGGYNYRNSSYGQSVLIQPSPIPQLRAGQLAIGLPIARGHVTAAYDLPTVDKARSRNLTATLNWDVSDNLTLTSISNVTRFTEDGVLDVDHGPHGVAIGRGFTDNSGYPVQWIFTGFPRIPDRYTYYSQEFRANYRSGPVDAVFGAYYSHVRNTYASLIAFMFDAPITPVQFVSYSLPDSKVQDTTASVFGDVTYSLTDQFKVFGGLRYTNETLDVDYTRTEWNIPFASGGFNPVTGTFSVPPTFRYQTSADTKVNNLSGRVGVRFEPNDDVNLYASYARGYKAPAADIGGSLAVGVDPIVDPEIADAYEVGAKLRLFDGRLAINGAVFYQEIDGVQATVVPPGVDLRNQLVNAGTLKTRGFEGDFQFVVTPNLRLSGGVAYVKATYSGFLFNCNSVQTDTGTCPNDIDPTTGQPKIGFQDITGNPAIGSPKWKYTVNASYEDELPGADMSWYANLNWTWNSAVQFALDNSPISREPGHGMLNAAIGLKGPDDRWEVQLFGRNLLDEFYYSAKLSIPIIGHEFGWLPRDYRRYGGVKLTYRF